MPKVSYASLRTSRIGFMDTESTASSAFEVALELPVRDHVVVEDDLLLHRGIQQVLEHEVAERFSSHLARAERLDGLVERARHTRDILGLVGVPVEHLGRGDPVRDAVQTTGDGRGEREVRVRVSTRDPALHTVALMLAHHAEAAGAVVVAPHDGGRCTPAQLVPLVRVYEPR